MTRCPICVIRIGPISTLSASTGSAIRSIMKLASPNRADHDVYFMIDAW
jgi:hypothetical protein